MVDLEMESAQNLFDTLSILIENVNINIKDAVGFGADTTNVIFSIKDVIPNCLFIKCVCRCVALSVSHASKEPLPSAVKQVVKMFTDI